jgi:hypothetical protein
MPDDPEVVITAADDTDLDGLVERLAAKGLTNCAALPGVGIITGHAAEGLLDGLRSEPGVAAVELAGGVQLPPPDSDVQ